VTKSCLSEVHERVATKGLRVETLRSPVLHYSYDSPDDFLRKMRAYSQLFAAQHVGKKASNPGRALGSSLWAFVKSYFLQRGFLQGFDGLTISVYKAQTSFWKYQFLHQANREACRSSS
jgi:hypothetical protein